MAPDGVLQKVVASLKSVGDFEVAALSLQTNSSVYKAVEKKLRRALIIKLMPLTQWGANAIAIATLAGAERKAVKSFDFPNIPRLLTGGEVDSHLFWITEFVDGVALSATIEKGEVLSALDLVDMARQLCTCVESTSKSGVVHHRLHPGNLIIEWDGGAKILDWGVPPYTDLNAGTSAKTLKAAHYLAPEQLAGQLGDTRSNLFSVGVMLYQLATGKLPFPGDSIAEIRAAMKAGEVKNPSQLNPKIPAGISAPILRVLSPDPKERYLTASELTRDLENYKKFGVKEELPANFYAPKQAQGQVISINAPRSGSAAPDTTLELDSAWTPAVTTSRPSDIAMMSVQDSAVAVAERPMQPKQQAPETAVLEVPLVKETVYSEPEPKPVPPPKAKVVLKKIKPPKVTMKDVTRVVNKIPPVPAALGLAAIVVAFMVWKIIVPYTIAKDMPSVQASQPTVTQPVAAVPQPAEQPATTEASAPAEPEVVVRSFNANGKPIKKSKVKTAPVVAPAAPTVGELSVSTEPAGASFQVDGRSDASYVTPAVVGQLSPGRHVVTFTKQGYQAQSLTADVSAGSRSTMVTRLAVQGGTLSIGSNPPGASIVIDGRETGKVTPAQFIMPHGQHSVVLKLAGYLEATTPVSVADGQTHSIAPELVAMGRTMDIKTTKKGLFGLGGRNDKDMGKVNIRTTPAGATVSVNGQLAPKSAPLEFSLNPGGYELLFQLRGYKPLKKVVVVEAGSKLVVNETLQPE